MTAKFFGTVYASYKMQAGGNRVRSGEVGKVTTGALEMLIEVSVVIMAGIVGVGPLVVVA